MDQRYQRPATLRPIAEVDSYDPQRLEESFDRAFSLVAFIVNRHLVDHMLRTARHFEIDYEMIVLWAVLAHQNVAHLMPPGSVPSKLLNEQGMLHDRGARALRPLRLRDLTQITGIPRETARRKLLALRDFGWIVEGEQGWQINRERVDPELREFTKETARRFIAAAADAVRALREVEEASTA